MFKSGIAYVPVGGTGTAPDAAASPFGTTLSLNRGPNRTNQAAMTVIVSNLEAAGANTLEISFDKGHSWFTLATMTTFSFNVITHQVNVRGTTGATADFSVMVIV